MLVFALQGSTLLVKSGHWSFQITCFFDNKNNNITLIKFKDKNKLAFTVVGDSSFCVDEEKKFFKDSTFFRWDKGRSVIFMVEFTSGIPTSYQFDANKKIWHEVR